MYCQNCNNKLPDNARFCNKCGRPITIETTKEITKNIDIEYFSIPPKRLALLSILTFGIYEIYWFAKNWSAVKKAEQKKISPIGRGIFAVFYCHEFFKKVLQSAKQNGYNKTYSPGWLATFYISVLLIGNALGRIENTTIELDIIWLLIASSSFIPLVIVQKAINFNNSKIVQNFNESKKFTGGEIILTILSIIVFGLFLLGTFSPAITNDYSTESIAQVVNEIKAELNPPYQIDDVTTLVDITAQQSAIRYHYVLDGADTSNLSNSYLKNYLKSSVCQNTDTKNLLNNGINLEYSYIVDGSAQIYLVTFNKTDCLY